MTRTKGHGPLADRLRIASGARVTLASIDPDATHGHEKAEAEGELARGIERLAGLQDRLWAQQERAVLVVLQGIDTAGKDGTIRHVVGAFNPQGCKVWSFKVPSVEERAHDFLWRVNARTPPKGEIAIFNRSHYEDVLVVRVHKLAPKKVWARRYDHINSWERMLSDEGTTILKFFLLIDRDQQRARLQARIDEPTKNWKFSPSDLPERALWDDYIAAYQDCLSKTSTEWAPWYVIPANRKWFRNLAVAEILGDALAGLHPRYPAPAAHLSGIIVP